MIKDKKTLFDLLNEASKIDEQEEIDFEQLGLVWDDIKYKTDSIAMLMSKWEAEADRLKGLSSQFMQASRSLSKRKTSLLDYLKTTMKINDVEQLQGKMFKFKIQKRKGLSYPELNDDLEKKYPEFIRKKTEWNKILIKDSFKKEKLNTPFVQEVITESLRQSIVK